MIKDNDVMIDNFAVNPIPSCPQPQYISSFNITTDSASLTWTSIGSDSAWIVYLTPSGVNPDSSHMLIVNNDSVTYSGLNSNTFMISMFKVFVLEEILVSYQVLIQF